MSDLPFAHEKFLAALAEIAISDDSLQDRLFKAFTGRLAMLEPHKLPERIRIQYEEVLQEMTRGDEGTQGSLFAATRVMPQERAALIIQKLINIANEVALDMGTEDSQQQNKPRL
jgi:hypothetical protein